MNPIKLSYIESRPVLVTSHHFSGIIQQTFNSFENLY